MRSYRTSRRKDPEFAYANHLLGQLRSAMRLNQSLAVASNRSPEVAARRRVETIRKAMVAILDMRDF